MYVFVGCNCVRARAHSVRTVLPNAYPPARTLNSTNRKKGSAPDAAPCTRFAPCARARSQFVPHRIYCFRHRSVGLVCWCLLCCCVVVHVGVACACRLRGRTLSSAHAHAGSSTADANAPVCVRVIVCASWYWLIGRGARAR